MLGFGESWAQGFKVATTENISKISVILEKQGAGSIDGTITAYIYSDSSGYPNAAVATFSNMAASGLTTTFTEYNFTGSFTPVVGTQYHLVLLRTGATIGNWNFELNSAGGYADGMISYTGNGGSTWSRIFGTTYDAYFKLYQDKINLQSYSEATIKNQGSYSLKGAALATGSLNATLTRTVSPTINLTGKTSIKFDIRSSRTGSNIKLGITKAETEDQVQVTYNDEQALGDSTNNELREAQSFQIGAGKVVSAVEVRVGTIYNTPAGNWTVTIQTDNAGVPSGTLAHANASVVVPPPSANSVKKISFANPFPLSASTTYWAVIDSDDQSLHNRWMLSIWYGSSVYAGGNWGRKMNGVWTAYPTDADMYFKIYTAAVITEKTHSVSSANTWETDTWDISGVANADKNAINMIIATITNADADNTFYIDNMYSSAASANDIVFTTGSSERMRIDSSGNVKISAGGSASKVICWKSDGVTLGYCSDLATSTGGCTCN